MDCGRSTILHPAVVLLGPTGSGKTPLGELVQSRGLWGRSCVHFDFGAQLRALAVGSTTDRQSGTAVVDKEFTAEEIAFVRDVLARGALLEDHQFPLARKILRRFIVTSELTPESLLVLNGLPRHVGQAERLAGLLEVHAVIELSCPAEVVFQRIRRNVGGDRQWRHDDDPSSVAHRVEIYHRRTAPLVEYYRNLGVPIVRVPVGPETTAEQIWEALQGQLAAAASGAAPQCARHRPPSAQAPEGRSQ